MVLFVIELIFTQPLLSPLLALQLLPQNLVSKCPVRLPPSYPSIRKEHFFRGWVDFVTGTPKEDSCAANALGSIPVSIYECYLFRDYVFDGLVRES